MTTAETLEKAKSKTEQNPAPGAIQAIVEGRHGDPFAVLGPHGGSGAPLTVNVFLPTADAVEVVDAEGNSLASLQRIHDAGFFSGEVAEKTPGFTYRLKVRWPAAEEIREDPYRFPPTIGDLDIHLLGEGRHLRLYDVLGAHLRVIEGVSGVAFAVWAPNAKRVSVVGSFNHWDGRIHPMRLRHGSGVWELFVPGIGPGELYKYEIIGADGSRLPLKADPVGLASEHPPETASKVARSDPLPWKDEGWLKTREQAQALGAPVSIYECHLGSWARQDGWRMLNWDELGERLIPYVSDMGFTHIECLPISEFPFDGSWGYQPIGLFAPTSRFGSPEAFQRFVEKAHQAGIGVIIDWVPGHFPTDAHGLGNFDGTALYEHADPRQGFHKDWSTLIYNYGRREVLNFLLANALYWLDKFHIDGLRVDAVASMLYLDYSRQPGEWVPNMYGGNENLEAVSFLKQLNELAYGHFPGTITVAEESTAWPSVSRPTYLGGLGFGYKWNMGWMHDTLSYMSHEPIHRRFHQNQLTFGLLYAFSENFVLPLSHDEVVHGKGSLLGRMPGDRWQKFANLRAYFGFMWTHPGKKLLFMGGEFGQEREWNHDASLDWHLLDDPMHRGVQKLVRDLNGAYRSLPALHAKDCDPSGFQWVDASDSENSVICYLRFGNDGDKPVLVVSNFTPIVRHDYRIGVPQGGLWHERVNTDAADYGGSGVGNGGAVRADEASWHGRSHSLCLTLPPLATLVLEPE
ncbi:1,4-alpha-glucan branching enzyme [Rhodoligotrophos appendicifer]|uniref:1,4-alpha-glucan branching protein GlgB n=1 Tax=Rhodoligotrophos appendicifer TaxID=987056 RepID=UPI001FE38370|nr:1,4-alpha-glucan branching protein GlgB [Rhodoligotrophos appendicifer]